MSELMPLFPAPRRVVAYGTRHTLPAQGLLLLDMLRPAEALVVAQMVQQALPPGTTWEVVASPQVPREQVALVLRLEPTRVPYDQGYELTIVPTGISLHAHDAAGLFYGVVTLIQLFAAAGPTRQLPCLQIFDWPDFPVRGVLLDVSRDKVPTLTTLLALVDQLARWKINQLQLYTEHTFAYRQHPMVWAQASPLTGEDILRLDAYCRERFIELVPNQNSFGHFERWLKYPQYAPLAEIQGPFTAFDGETLEGPFSLCPLDPGSLTLLTGLYDELLPHFTSRLLNVGGDETFDLGQGRSRAVCDMRGLGTVYLEFMQQIHAAVQARGRRMQYWGDMLLRYPELLPEMPREAIVLAWGYEAAHPFDMQNLMLNMAHLPFYVCPGTSSWNSLAGRVANAQANLANAAENGLKHGAAGYLITDWGDNGHWQPPAISDLGWALGAAYSWCWETNAHWDPTELLNLVWQDPTGQLGAGAVALGNAYQLVGHEPHNASALFHALVKPVTELQKRYGDVTAATWEKADAAVAQGLDQIRHATPAVPQAATLQRELVLMGELQRHATRRARWAKNPAPEQGATLATELKALREELRAVWLLRHRPGGLSDSLARFDPVLATYRS